MSLSTSRFVINKGLSNEFILTIKKNGSLLPIEIDPSDTFRLVIFELETGDEVGEVGSTATASGQITVESALEGQIKIVLNDALVNSLEKEVGGKEDRYYLRPLYRIAIECNTVDNGSFIAKIPLVYVE